MSMTNTADIVNNTNQIEIEQVKKKIRIKSFYKGMAFLLPSIILFSVFLFYPMFRTIYLSFFLTKASGDTTVFVGIENYVNMFTSPIFLKSMKSTFFICFIYGTYYHDY